MPFKIKKIVTYFIALIIYYPLSKIAKIFDRLGFNVNNFPLSYYRTKIFILWLLTHWIDLAQSLKKDLQKKRVEKMLLDAGFVDIKFSKNTPYWVALAWKK